MRQLPKHETNPDVLVGLETPDDAGVYKVSDDLALIQTLDFFTPIVDDPYMYGQIAAANSLSDIYAMGGQPLTCMNIVGYPINKLGPEMLAEILRGSADKVKESGASLIGGHSIDNVEPIIGLSVTGKAHPGEIWTNVGAKPGDKLIITKPIGVGIQTKGIKDAVLDKVKIKRVTEVMSQLNKYAAEVMKGYPISAVTDVTGFGLLGHALEMITKTNVGLVIDSSTVPILEGTKELAIKNVVPAGSKDNLRWVSKHTTFAERLDYHDQLILADAVTSGGLLVAVKGDMAETLLEEMHDNGVIDAKIIGEFTDKHPEKIIVI
ncbi:selenide, water dikinase SelD [Vulcanibacillus modesticaldus]|uniref:Selenide, water dikinase n=1 Tax=Vulcanibacillus modesticaldus TaxID=337097 RepID=A0A1D2YV59_9BACI|nr:selenide, water dikinase SelD [Vulcanibacillus modesticaldus]